MAERRFAVGGNMGKKANKKSKATASVKRTEKVMRKPMQIISMRAEATDPQGSYTGVCADPLEKPVQDADDL